MKYFNGITCPKRTKDLHDWIKSIKGKDDEFVNAQVKERETHLNELTSALRTEMHSIDTSGKELKHELGLFLANAVLPNNRVAKPGDIIIKSNHDVHYRLSIMFARSRNENYFESKEVQVITEKNKGKFITDKDIIPYTHVSKGNYIIISVVDFAVFSNIMKKMKQQQVVTSAAERVLNQEISEIWYEKCKVSAQSSHSRSMAAAMSKRYAEWDGRGRSPSA